MSVVTDLKNPFTVQTPEDIPAQEVISLFVDVFSDFHRVPYAEHCFLHGPRGSGKSMMFRFLQPDCQSLHLACEFKDLPFLGIYVPVKNTSLDLAELARLELHHAATLLNEHFLIMYIAVKAFDSLAKLDCFPRGKSELASILRFYNEEFLGRLKRCGWKQSRRGKVRFDSVAATFRSMERLCDEIFGSVINYLKQLSFKNEPVPYTGPLCGFADFLLPLFNAMRELKFMPHAPIYLLIDDADNLNLIQTRILNSWVASRTSAQISIKVSTQLNYKTYTTISGRTIDAPHDYAEVNISEVYTSPKSPYRKRVRDIVQRRLNLHNIDVDPAKFFPSNPSQDAGIEKIAQELKAAWNKGEGKGYRADDDVSRYARPDYIRGLKGTRKQGSNYSFAGFSQLVDISSGIIRYFLEAAALMFTKEKAASGRKPIRSIRHQFQSDVVRDLADKYLFAEFDKLAAGESSYPKISGADKSNRAMLLRNLILSMGRTFHEILISDRSERRIFSIALYDTPSADVAAVLALGVQYGYLHQSTIGNKEGTGRTWLYVLSRRLAPFFLLDPTGFAGYLFVKSSDLDKAMRQPYSRLRNLRIDPKSEQHKSQQLPLFE